MADPAQFKTFTMCVLDDFHSKTEGIYNQNVMLSSTEAKIQTEVVCRGRHFANFIVAPFVGVLDIIYSIILLIGAAFSRETDVVPRMMNAAKITVYSASGSMALSVIPYTSFLKFINPHAKIDDDSAKELGIALDFAAPKVMTVDTSRLLKGNFFQKHILTRLIHVGQLLAITIAKIVDFIIGLFAAIASIVLLGKSEKCNNFAAKQLNFVMSSVVSLGLLALIFDPFKLQEIKDSAAKFAMQTAVASVFEGRNLGSQREESFDTSMEDFDSDPSESFPYPTQSRSRPFTGSRGRGQEGQAPQCVQM